MKNNLFYIKIAGSILISFTVATILTNIVFVENTIGFRPSIGKNLFMKISQIVLSAQKVNKSSLKGIYEKSDPQFSYILLKEKEVEWSQYEFATNGKNITIFVPKGELPPPKKL